MGEGGGKKDAEENSKPSASRDARRDLPDSWLTRSTSQDALSRCIVLATASRTSAARRRADERVGQLTRGRYRVERNYFSISSVRCEGIVGFGVNINSALRRASQTQILSLRDDAQYRSLLRTIR